VAQLGPRGVGERLDGGLAGAVARHSGRLDDRGDGGDVEEVAAALDDVGQAGPHGAPHAEQVDFDDPVERVGIDAQDRAPHADPGVRDRDVDAAEAGGGFGGGGLDRLAVAGVGLDPHRRRPQLAGQALELVGLEPDEGQRAPRARRGRRAVAAPMPRAAPVIRTTRSRTG